MNELMGLLMERVAKVRVSQYIFLLKPKHVLVEAKVGMK